MGRSRLSTRSTWPSNQRRSPSCSGANGAGKTTLLRSLSGLLRPSAGTVRFDGRDLVKVPVELLVTLGVAHVPEGRGVVTELTVDENLRLGGLWRRDPRDTSPGDGRGVRAVRAARPAPVARRAPALRRRAADARAGPGVGGPPRLLLLDEPSLGLAPRVTAQIMGLLRHLRDTTGLTVLLVEQNVRGALSIADTGTVLALGRVVATGPAADCATTPTSATTIWASRGTSGPIPLPDPRRAGPRRGLRRLRARPRADLARHPDRQLRPGRDGRGDRVRRVQRHRRDRVLLARLRGRARRRSGARRGGGARGDALGRARAAAERRGGRRWAWCSAYRRCSA